MPKRKTLADTLGKNLNLGGGSGGGVGRAELVGDRGNEVFVVAGFRDGVEYVAVSHDYTPYPLC